MFRISSKRWAGLGKFVEESAELNQIIGKLMATRGDTKYWEDRDLLNDFEEEIADVLGVLTFIVNHNPQLNRERIVKRAGKKYSKFAGWRRDKLG